MIIDGHIHVGNWKGEHYARLKCDIDDIGEVLKKAGVDGAVLVKSETTTNEDVLNIVKNNKSDIKYWFFPWVNPNDDKQLEFLESNLEYISGLKFLPSSEKVKATDKKCYPFYEFAEKHNLPVFIHAGTWQEMASYNLILDVAKVFPKVIFVVLHAGGLLHNLRMGCIKRISQEKINNVMMEISGLANYWILEEAVDTLGSDKIIFGSDYPFCNPSIFVHLVETSNISASDKENIFSKNLMSLFNSKK